MAREHTSTGEDHYNGKVKNGRAHGEGEMKYGNGGIYVGQFVEGKRCGTGTMRFAGDLFNGAVYEGEWRGDCMHGKGVVKLDDESVHEGEWKDNKRSGKGVYKE
jgi:hypothetical protein